MTDDAPSSDPEGDARLQAKIVEDRALNEHRGAYLSTMCMIDLQIDSVLLAFFEVPAFRKQHLFRGSLLAQIGTDAKLDTIEYILKSTDLGPIEGHIKLLSDLRAANTKRNLLAHAFFGNNISGSTYSMVLMRFRKGKPQSVPVSVSGLESDAKGLNALFHPLVELQNAIAQLPRGDAAITAPPD